MILLPCFHVPPLQPWSSSRVLPTICILATALIGTVSTCLNHSNLHFAIAIGSTFASSNIPHLRAGATNNVSCFLQQVHHGNNQHQPGLSFATSGSTQSGSNGFGQQRFWIELSCKKDIMLKTELNSQAHILQHRDLLHGSSVQSHSNILGCEKYNHGWLSELQEARHYFIT